MLITLLKVTNFQRIRDIEIAPGDRSLMLIAGKNKQGKSSLLRAMSSALGGGKETPDKPVRTGESSAQILVELDDGATIITKTFNKAGKASLKVVNTEFGKLTSPQVALDKLVSGRFLDPLAFTRLNAKQQREKLLEIVPIDIDLDETAKKRKGLFDARTDANRDVKRLTAELGAFDAVDEIPERMDMAALIAKSDELQDTERRARTAQGVLDSNSARLVDAESIVGDLEHKLREAVAELEKLRVRVSEDATRLGPIAKVDAMPDLAAVREEMGKCDEHNAKVAKLESAKQSIDSVSEKLAKATLIANGFDSRIIALDKAKADALAAAKMPIDGLDLDEDAVLFNGVPLAQASGAEQLQISLAIASATSPELRDIWIEDGALLDDDSLALVSEFAAGNDLRVWLERVGESDDDCIIIEDGAIKESPAA